MARMEPIGIRITFDPTKEELRAIADQMGKVATRWHSLALEMDRLATLIGLDLD